MKRTIELHAPVDIVHAQWTRFESLSAYRSQDMVARVRWRAEVLTLEPVAEGTRLTLRVEYDRDPVRGDGGLANRLERVLRIFASFMDGWAAYPSAAVAP